MLNENQRSAASLRERFQENNVLCLNLLSSPGSGKTTLLENTLSLFPAEEKVAVLTVDLQTENNARRLAILDFLCNRSQRAVFVISMLA